MSAPPDDVTIRVINEGAGWRLECRPRFEAQMFRSGRAAEAAARSIAARFALSGLGVQMAVEDQGHAILGTTTFFPLPAPDTLNAAPTARGGLL